MAEMDRSDAPDKCPVCQRNYNRRLKAKTCKSLALPHITGTLCIDTHTGAMEPPMLYFHKDNGGED